MGSNKNKTNPAIDKTKEDLLRIFNSKNKVSKVNTNNIQDVKPINEINKNISRFNDSKAEPFELSVSMGYAEFSIDDNAEVFLRNMDDKMYEEKRRYHNRC